MAALENNSIQQEYADTCAIKSQQLILNDFGVPVSEDQLVQYSIEHGWYSGDGTGTQMGDVGKLLAEAGIIDPMEIVDNTPVKKQGVEALFKMPDQ